MLNHIAFVFYHNIKANESDLSQDLLTIENTDWDLKVHMLHYANEQFVCVRLSFQKLLQTRSTCRNNMKNDGKRAMTCTKLAVNKSTDSNNKTTFQFVFYHNIYITEYRKHRCISRTFLFKIFVSNRGCGLSAKSEDHAVNLHKLTLFSNLYRPV